MLRSAPKSRDFKKTIPKQISLDKERLYEELKTQKERLNRVQGENGRLRSRVQCLEEELVRGTKEEARPGQPQRDPTGSNIVTITFTLKKQLKEMSDVLADKEEEMQKIKRNVKLTKIQEIEVR